MYYYLLRAVGVVGMPRLVEADERMMLSVRVKIVRLM